MLGEYFQDEGKEGEGEGVLGLDSGFSVASTTNLSMRLWRLAKSSAPLPLSCGMSWAPFTSPASCC